MIKPKTHTDDRSGYLKPFYITLNECVEILVCNLTQNTLKHYLKSYIFNNEDLLWNFESLQIIENHIINYVCHWPLVPYIHTWSLTQNGDKNRILSRNRNMVLTLIFAVIISLQVNVNAAEEIPGETLKQEIENLKSLVSVLQKTSELNSLKINSLEKKSEDQQRIINQQRAILEKLLVENHGLKNKQQISVLNKANRTFRPEVNQKNGTLRPEVNQRNGTIRTDIGKHQNYGDSGDIRTLKEHLQITESRYRKIRPISNMSMYMHIQ